MIWATCPVNNSYTRISSVQQRHITLFGFSVLNSNKVPPMLASGLFCTAASIMVTNWIWLYIPMYSAHIFSIDGFRLSESFHKSPEENIWSYRFIHFLTIHMLSAQWLTDLHWVIYIHNTGFIFIGSRWYTHCQNIILIGKYLTSLYTPMKE